MSDTFPDETLYPVLESIADEDRIFASNSAAGHESSQIKGSTIKGLINALKGTPPETLDTLQKLAAAINDDPAFHTTLATALGLKQDASNAVTTDGDQAIDGSKTLRHAQGLRLFGPAGGGSHYGLNFGINGNTRQWYTLNYNAGGANQGTIAIVRTDGVVVMRLEYTLGNVSFPVSPTVPTAGASDNSTLAASTAFVQAQKADTALTGTPTAPTAAVGTNTTQIATTAFCAAGFLPRFEAVVERTAATTAEPNKLYVNVKHDAELDNTLMLTLPSPTGNAGKVIGFTSRYRRTFYIEEECNWQLTGHIDGIASNTYWQGYWEIASGLFWCDGTTWHLLTDWRAEQEW